MSNVFSSRSIVFPLLDDPDPAYGGSKCPGYSGLLPESRIERGTRKGTEETELDGARDEISRDNISGALMVGRVVGQFHLHFVD